MYSRYGNPPTRIAKNYIKDLVPGVDDKTARSLYEERIRFFEILDVSLDLSMYLSVLLLNATADIDTHGHLRSNDSLLGYSRDAMQEILVIRLRDLYHTEKDELEKFKFNIFHQTLDDMGIRYPRPNVSTNGALARIIHRRNHYSAHRRDGKAYSLKENPLSSTDLMTVASYIGKVEENLHGAKTFDLFERLLSDELDADRPLVWDYVYEALTWCAASIPEEGDRNTSGFAEYQAKARKELRNIRVKVEKAISK